MAWVNKIKQLKIKISSVIFLVIFLMFYFAGCTSNTSRGLTKTTKILLTSEDGDKLTEQDNVKFQKGEASGNIIQVFPDEIKQTIYGIGSSFTESSAFVLAHLRVEERQRVMENIFGENGANFTFTRTHIGACDFTVSGRYSYADEKDDAILESFNISVDKKGFSKQNYPNIEDETYDLLPMIKEAQSIKNNQAEQELKIISSAWTAPSWMKDIEDWYIPGSPENNWQGTGGSLKPKYESVYADYLIKYLEEYKKEGVEIWGITPVNEPHGNNGQWESMNFTPESQNLFIKNYLGPKLHENGFKNIKLFIYDQNRDGLEHWADTILSDPETKPYITGTAVHWYESTFKVFEDIFKRVHEKFPQFSIIHTEGCIDDLGKNAPGGVTDPIKFKEKNWFDNDEFWWNANATDWAYSVTWEGVKVEDHPAYTPVHRYARNIIVSIDNWLQGWIDWNIVLDKQGGPNHVGNFCGAPIMIDTETGYVYYTPIFHVLKQFSRTIRPGDVGVQTSKITDDLGEDDLHVCATINSNHLVSVQLLNTTKNNIEYNLQIGDQYAPIEIKANSVQTVRVQM